MKIAFNCCTKPVLHKPSLTLFKGEAVQDKAPIAAGAEIKAQPKQDTVELSSKTATANIQTVPATTDTAKKAEKAAEPVKAEAKCEGGNCK